VSTKHRPTRSSGLTKPTRSLREQYLSLMAKRPLLPADVRRLELLAALLVIEQDRKAQNASK